MMQPEHDAVLRVMANQSPVMLWVAGTDGNCVFFNDTWLEFTGRDLEMEVGSGWAEGVHAEDFQDCMDQYLVAFVARRAFRMEYRLRRADGAYRVLLDHGVPRYGKDGTFEGFIGSCIDVTDMRAATNELHAALEERDVLLAETHHRVKNNLQIVSSILALQVRTLPEGERDALLQAQRRIDSIALVHEQLYGTRNLAAINLADYARSLVHDLWRASEKGGNIQLKLDLVADVEIAPDRAIPCGLVISELVTNALKHAFPKGRGTVTIRLGYVTPSTLRLSVSDDGIGLAASRQQGVGLDLVSIFAEQLDATIDVVEKNGTTFHFTFEEP